MRLSIRQRSPLACALIATSSTLFAASCLDLQVTSETAGAGGAGSSSSGEPTSSSSNGSSASVASSSSGSSSSSASSASASSGMVAVCGNGIAEGNEQCDDGNTTAGDGCSANCQLEAPGNCSAEVINLIKGQKVTIDGSNVGSTDTFKGAITGTTGNCGNGNWTGPDEIYAVMAKDGGTLTVSANVSYNNSMLHVRSQCPGEPADQLACEYRTSPGTLSWTLQLNQDTAYYVAVDAFTATGGSFQVTFELQ